MKKENTSVDLFDLKDIFAWRQEWIDMPDFSQDDLTPVHQLTINFKTREDVKRFSELLNKKITAKTKSIWFPDNNRIIPSEYVWTNTEDIKPKYPIYIISKGRWDTRLTAKALDKMNISYKICVEPKEYDNYKSVIDESKIIKLPENFSERNEGSIPVRNFVFDHSVQQNAKRHWILDDNIDGFVRLNNNTKIKVDNGATFRAIEDFSDRYENVMMSGMDYRYFANQDAVSMPYTLNTRIYSCILLNNELSHRWRGRYNEDTDLSIRILKDGFCTVLFKAFLCNKITTMSMSGGNTDTIYNTGDNRKAFAESLQQQHPDITKVIWRYDRWHHEVDYSRFMKNNKLKLKSDICIKSKINNYGLELKRVF